MNPNRGMLHLTAAVFSLLSPASHSQTRSQPDGHAATASAPKTTDQAFKNIQVLKNLPEHELMPAMQFITSSLGVGCDFCHVQGHFEQDDKKTKLTARKMMQMVAAINQNNFDGHREVTCNTCHAASPRPVSIPPISDTEPKGETAEAALPPNLPTPEQLLTKYVQALGGANAVGAVTSRVIQGTTTVAGQEIAIEIFNKAPSRRISVMHMPGGDSITAFDGHEGWLTMPGRPVREMRAGELDAARMDADLQFAVHLKEMFSDFKPDQPEKVGGREAYLLVASNPGKPPVRLYFDKESGLLVRMIRYVDSPLGLNPARIDYEAYSAVDGVQVAHRWTIARPNGRFTVHAAEIKQNVPVADSKFDKPAPAPPTQ